MKLEVGGTYRSRNGKTVKIVAKKDYGTWNFADEDGIRYAENGFYFTSPDDPDNLIERIDVPSMQEDFHPQSIPGTPLDLPAPEEAVGVGWNGRFDEADVLAVWDLYQRLLTMPMAERPDVSLVDLISLRKTLLRETE